MYDIVEIVYNVIANHNFYTDNNSSSYILDSAISLASLTIIRVHTRTTYMNMLAINSNLNEPPTRGQPPKRGQKLCDQSVLYSEVPLYTVI